MRRWSSICNQNILWQATVDRCGQPRHRNLPAIVKTSHLSFGVHAGIGPGSTVNHDRLSNHPTDDTLKRGLDGPNHFSRGRILTLPPTKGGAVIGHGQAKARHGQFPNKFFVPNIPFASNHASASSTEAKIRVAVSVMNGLGLLAGFHTT